MNDLQYLEQLFTEKINGLKDYLSGILQGLQTNYDALRNDFDKLEKRFERVMNELYEGDRKIESKMIACREESNKRLNDLSTRQTKDEASSEALKEAKASGRAQVGLIATIITISIAIISFFLGRI